MCPGGYLIESNSEDATIQLILCTVGSTTLGPGAMLARSPNFYLTRPRHVLFSIASVCLSVAKITVKTVKMLS